MPAMRQWDIRMKLTAVLSLAAFSAASLVAQAPRPAAKPKSTAPAKAKARVAPGTPAKAPAAAASVSPSEGAQSPAGDSKVVMTVGEEKITQKDFDDLIESLPEQARAQARGPMKRQMAEQIARVKLLAAEAKKKGLDKDPGVQTRIRFQTENLLAGAAFNEFQKNAKVDEPAVRKYYDEHKNEFENVEARHILIKFRGSPVPAREGKAELTEEEALAKAQEIRKRLVAGEEFEKLAKEESDDTGSGANGGSLGSFGHGQMVPEFEKAAFALPIGQVSEPIRTQFGYHIIRVDKHEAKAFDEVRTQLEQKLRPETARNSVEQLRQASNVVLDEAYFGPAQPPARPAAPAPPKPANP
jgi:peptidyl-prolyl cis-trans isomerase C